MSRDSLFLAVAIGFLFLMLAGYMVFEFGYTVGRCTP